MLEEFSQFNFTVIIIGYILMVIYAALSQFDWDGWWLSPKACCSAAIVGVLIITYSSIAGLGLSAMMGIHFNAATTQIVPFISLGLGIDDMFLVLHSYGQVLENVKVNEIGVLMKETGMSIMITSINIVFAFFAGTILPIPALRSFCSQAAILLTFNMVANLIVFPAFISLDLKRRKAGRRDLAYCCFDKDDTISNIKGEESSNQLVKNVSIASNTTAMAQFTTSKEEIRPESTSDLKMYTLEGFLKLFYIPLLKKGTTKVAILILCASMFIFGCLGLYRSKVGDLRND
jgi:patched 1 protein